MKLSAYITNLGKYNEGYLIGKWVDFPIDDDELNEILKEIGCTYEDEDGNIHNAEYEEYFMTDYECEIDLNLSEYESVEHLNEIAETIGQWEDENTAKAVIEWLGIDEFMDANEDDYYLHTDINNDYDLGYYWAEESGCYNLQELGTLANYIDYEAFGRDIDMDGNGYFSSYGYIMAY